MSKKVVSEIEELFLNFDEAKKPLTELARLIKQSPGLSEASAETVSHGLRGMNDATRAFIDSIHTLIDDIGRKSAPVV